MAGRKKETDELESLIVALDKQFGKGSLMRIGDGPVQQFPVFPSGSLKLDLALGVGGIPRGRVIEVFGPESSGKTSLCLEVVAQAQKLGGVAAFVDAEHALDISYAKRLGVNVEDLLVSQPDCGEQALDIVESLVRSGLLDIIVIDSVAALVPRAEIEGDMGDHHMGLQARLMSQALRKLVAACHKHDCAVMFVNQLRMKIGVVFGNPETTTGGNALRFYSSIRLEVRRAGTQKNGKEATGNRVRVKVVKNKMAPPYTEAQFDLVFGKGINRIKDLIETAEQLDVVEKSGSWISFRGDRLGQGYEQVEEKLREETDLLAAIEDEVKDRFPGTRVEEPESKTAVAEAAEAAAA